MGMPIVVDVRDDDVGDDALDACSTGSARSTRRSAPTGTTARSAGSTAASSRSPTRIRTCARCSTAARRCALETDGYFDCARRPATRSTRRGSSRAGRSTARPRSSTPPGLRELRDQRRRRHPPRGRALPAVTGASGSSIPLERDRIAASRRGATTARSRRPARTRAATTCSTRTRGHPPAGRPLGHDHRPRARDRRRVRDRRVRDGRRRRRRGRRGCAATRR